MIELEETAAGVVLPVHAQPGARRSGIAGQHSGRLKVSVTQAPEKGKANEALAKVLCEALQLKRSQVVLLAGATSSRKRFLLTGIDRDEIQRRIAEQLEFKL